MSDVWEIPFLNPKAKERTGYPTQKPLILLDRILEISSDKGDIILDPFCGSGTTLVSAKLLDRKYIGFDINQDAIEITKERLINPIKTKSALLEKGMSSYDTKTDFEKSILAQFDCDVVQRNKGLDGILRKQYNNLGIGIKIQKSTETLKESAELLKEAMKKRKFEYSILVQTHLDGENESIDCKNIILIPSYDLHFKSEWNLRT